MLRGVRSIQPSKTAVRIKPRVERERNAGSGRQEDIRAIEDSERPLLAAVCRPLTRACMFVQSQPRARPSDFARGFMLTARLRGLKTEIA